MSLVKQIQEHIERLENDNVALNRENDRLRKLYKAEHEISNGYGITNEQLKAQNSALKHELERYSDYVDTANYDSEKVAIKATYLEMEIGQLKAQNAALLECVQWYTDLENWKLSQRARECIAKLGGERDDNR